jgi:hypothetical protein
VKPNLSMVFLVYKLKKLQRKCSENIKHEINLLFDHVTVPLNVGSDLYSGRFTRDAFINTKLCKV